MNVPFRLTIGLIAMVVSSASYADQTIDAVDNGEVKCVASKDDLTRFSLEGDQFAAVSKVSANNPSQDFDVVNEPTRGDIYVSVPASYTRPAISFFGTTSKGYVYKFVCAVSATGAEQVFIKNKMEVARPKEHLAIAPQLPLKDQAADLIKAMFAQRVVDGYDIVDELRAPVNVGNLKVQLVSEYRGLVLDGKVLRVTNTGEDPVTLEDRLLVPEGAVAVAISNNQLAKGQTTGAYVVVPGGEFQ
ncbi:conjugal transfer protein TraK [Altericroceibacterium spongiae]|uniref:Conjugal transfer protein TraK n=1 Tax=Altericroceibacterium spongiae TaxID=2320269 RepID=A0A420EAL1_9SPHN|nr:type-F conjugative transfer system secretin TraK [Altericroceibacterium spongiae]RKF17700.1 conjugal transfer protein TraK [Altericroceibacterium spongiae]